MLHRQIAHQRLHNQHIARQMFKQPHEVVGWLGALQGQDYPGAKWSVGLRLPGSTDADIERALAEKTIVRTWVMRGTLHLAAGDDIGWLLALVGPRLIAGSARRYRELELDDTTLARSSELLASAVHEHRQLTRSALFAMLAANGISTAGQRGYYMLHHASLRSLICQGVARGGDPTFVALPDTTAMPRDEAAAELARRYFTSRGPATMKDFLWWSGLAAAEARAALDAIRSELVEQTMDGQTYWHSASMSDAEPDTSSIYLLPGFDEYLLGYADRSAVLDPQHASKVCPGGNGVFYPTVVIDGQMVGTWKRAFKKSTVIMTPTPFDTRTVVDREALTAAAQPFGHFLGMPMMFS